MTALPRHMLPQSLLMIAECCGDEVMWAIWEHFGGGRFQVPQRATPDHVLSDLLGFPQACDFCQHFGGEFLTIAKADAARRAVRNELIRLAKAEGTDNFTLARRFGLTDRQIMTICQAQSPPLNFDLFD